MNACASMHLTCWWQNMRSSRQQFPCNLFASEITDLFSKSFSVEQPLDYPGRFHRCAMFLPPNWRVWPMPIISLLFVWFQSYFSRWKRTCFFNIQVTLPYNRRVTKSFVNMVRKISSSPIFNCCCLGSLTAIRMICCPCHLRFPHTHTQQLPGSISDL